MRYLLVLLALLLAAPAVAAPAPAVITPATIGAEAFHEDWEAPDMGPDVDAKAKPLHRWRTVMGSGGPGSLSNRTITGTSVAVDGTVGIDPILRRPGRIVMQSGAMPAAVAPTLWGKPYYGASLTTKFSFSQRFGYFETTLVLPKGRGPYTAWWLMPVSSGAGWPINGELDILETTGDPGVIYTTVISATLPGACHCLQKRVPLGFDGSAGAHRYGAWWGQDEIVWYVDRREVFRAPTPADMKTQPMYPLLWLGMGTAWNDDYPDAKTPMPAQMVVYPVRAWRLP